MSGTDYTNDAQQRLLRLVLLLAGNEVTGTAPADIAREQGCSASMVTRDMANLVQAGWAELVPETGRWRLAPQVVQIAVRHMVALDRATQRLDEVRQRYGVGTPRAAAEQGLQRFGPGGNGLARPSILSTPTPTPTPAN